MNHFNNILRIAAGGLYNELPCIYDLSVRVTSSPNHTRRYYKKC